MSPRFSIIIPAYNAEAHLRATLQSVAEQTFRDFEVLVVDDGSTDRTRALAEETIRELGLRGEVLDRPASAPKGVSSARNTGLARARAAWVAFLDSDDLYAPQALERTDVVLRALGPDVRAVHLRTERFDDASGDALGRFGPDGLDGLRDLRSMLLEGNFIPPCAAVLDRELVREIGGFDVRLNGIEDYWLVLQVSRRTRWLCIDEVLARYRVRSTSLMHGRPLAQYAAQNARLLRVAAESRELDLLEMAVLRSQLLGWQLRHFEGQAFARDGWLGVLGGYWTLAREGFPRAALDLMARRARHMVLSLGSTAHRAVRYRQTGG